VAALTGDGGLNMTLGELETARRLGIGFALIVVNNAASGYVKALQHLMYGEGAYQSADLSETDYAAAACALGCHGIRVERPDDLAGALRDACAKPRVRSWLTSWSLAIPRTCSRASTPARSRPKRATGWPEDRRCHDSIQVVAYIASDDGAGQQQWALSRPGVGRCADQGAANPRRAPRPVR